MYFTLLRPQMTHFLISHVLLCSSYSLCDFPFTYVNVINQSISNFVAYLCLINERNTCGHPDSTILKASFRFSESNIQLASICKGHLSQKTLRNASEVWSSPWGQINNRNLNHLRSIAELCHHFCLAQSLNHRRWVFSITLLVYNFFFPIYPARFSIKCPTWDHLKPSVHPAIHYLL